MQSNNSKVGAKVLCNGFAGTVVRTKDSPGSAWMGGMVEVWLARGVVCVSDNAPDVVLDHPAGAASRSSFKRWMGARA